MHLPTPLLFKKELVVYILGSKIRQPTLSRIASTCTFLIDTHGNPKWKLAHPDMLQQFRIHQMICNLPL